MSTRIQVMTITVIAAAALEANRFVSIDGTYAANTAPLGVTQRTAAKDEAAAVDTLGIAPVLAAEAITAGELVSSDAEGKAIVATDNALVAGRALQDALAGELVRVLIIPANTVAAG